jgi:hypothetical protein
MMQKEHAPPMPTENWDMTITTGSQVPASLSFTAPALRPCQYTPHALLFRCNPIANFMSVPMVQDGLAKAFEMLVEPEDSLLVEAATYRSGVTYPPSVPTNRRRRPRTSPTAGRSPFWVPSAATSCRYLPS